MVLYDEKEKRVYDSAGGGEAGEKAVLARREYLQNYNAMMSQHYREVARSRYTPRSEKTNATSRILHDNHN